MPLADKILLLNTLVFRKLVSENRKLDSLQDKRVQNLVSKINVQCFLESYNVAEIHRKWLKTLDNEALNKTHNLVM